MIELQDITLNKDDKTIFNHLNIKFDKGKSYALIGKSGSGKSTLLNLIAGLEKNKKHQIMIDGKLQKFNHQFYKNDLGYLFQNYGLIDNLSIDANLDLGLAFKKISRQQKKALKLKYLKEFGLTADSKRKVHTLSGGEQQRVALIRLILKDPAIILADEPTGSLDQQTGLQIMDALFSMLTKDKVLIMATHDMTLAERCDEIIDIEKYKKI
ncbi:ATP-binding cassette domain-containing protein [Staphylococcus simiae]|uniref:ATP-binding cassette domain-containing protein n=1 Tax=Staphylococcus simiae TaxID=308354 RepID=UPI001A971649|nr:ATP-binding cassette domain-containing protein [Staphylococcus simiae]MBO1198884.1 ATP-binding cassette domain-containing protein [Staphylococcus simiae]MBO1201090.1 ATP-binding cassette domain-containing protein [Staphylococcus simiae]MBO1203284.1 ATP-binding cassette domain-containing protein [Staphylococcus simiae]MBO1210767.1 ATP-binding cassette domain-containing protein [Staphylococcus simiae]MBO1229428.1 ATP-binding cassette domain-containing protein [Staphylococcus simiae]